MGHIQGRGRAAGMDRAGLGSFAGVVGGNIRLVPEAGLKRRLCQPL